MLSGYLWRDIIVSQDPNPPGVAGEAILVSYCIELRKLPLSGLSFWTWCNYES